MFLKKNNSSYLINKNFDNLNLLKKIIILITLTTYSFAAVPLYEYLAIKNIVIPLAKNIINDIFNLLKNPIKKYDKKHIKELKIELNKILKYKKMVDEKLIYILYKTKSLNIGLLKISYKLSLRYRLLLSKNKKLFKDLKIDSNIYYKKIYNEDKKLLLLILIYYKKHKEYFIFNKKHTNNILIYLKYYLQQAINEIY